MHQRRGRSGDSVRGLHVIVVLSQQKLCVSHGSSYLIATGRNGSFRVFWLKEVHRVATLQIAFCHCALSMWRKGDISVVLVMCGDTVTVTPLTEKPLLRAL